MLTAGSSCCCCSCAGWTQSIGSPPCCLLASCCHWSPAGRCCHPACACRGLFAVLASHLLLPARLRCHPCLHTPMPLCHAALSPAAADGCLQGPVAVLLAHTEHCRSAMLPSHQQLLVPPCRTLLQSCLPASSGACLRCWMARVTAPAAPSSKPSWQRCWVQARARSLATGSACVVSPVSSMSGKGASPTGVWQTKGWDTEAHYDTACW